MMSEEIRRQGTMFIFSGPSGGGKSSIIKEIMKKIPNLVLSISVTTREKREGEIDGKDYYFISEEKFREMVAQDALYEYVDSDFGPKYGTPKRAVDELLCQGKDVILDLDYPGVQQLRALAGNRVKAISLLPPSLKILHKRLVERGTDTSDVINRRMSMAEKRVRESVFYDYVIVNNDLNKAVEEAEAIILSVRALRDNLCGLEDFIEKIVEEK